MKEVFPKLYELGFVKLNLNRIEGYVVSDNVKCKAAIEKIKTLQGQTHQLNSAVSVAKNGAILWSAESQADMTMHTLSDTFITRYAQSAGDVLTQCVGAYAYEEHGAWLFEKVVGDYFTILGMPLPQLLHYLRTEQGVTL